MKTFIITILFISIIIPISSLSAGGKKAICTGNNVNIRKNPEIGNNILFQCNIADIVEVLEVPENDVKLGDQSNYFKKVKVKNIIGWINNKYISDLYGHLENQDIIIWTVIVNLVGASNEYSLTVYDINSKKIKSTTFNASKFIFTKNYKYVFIDSGSYVVRSFEIYELPTIKLIHKGSYLVDEYDFIKSANNVFIFKEFTIDKVYENWNEVIFENGLFKKTGKHGIFRDR